MHSLNTFLKDQQKKDDLIQYIIILWYQLLQDVVMIVTDLCSFKQEVDTFTDTYQGLIAITAEQNVRNT